MPRLKIDDDELDDELDELEYDEGNFERYTGEMPPKDTILRGYVKSLWLTETQAGDRMFKMLFIAANNEGDEEEYNGLPIWENYALIGSAKFKWGPFFKQFGLTIRLVKTKMYGETDDDNIGAPITKIGSFKPGEENDSAWCSVLTKTEKYNGKDQVHIAEWMDYDADEEDEDEEAEDEDEELDEEEDEEVEEEEEGDEEAEEEPPPSRTRRAASGKTSAQPATKSAATSKSAGTRTSAAKTSATARTAAKPAANDGRKSTSKAPAKSVSKSTASAKPAAKAAPARGARRTKAATEGYDEDPPF